VGAHVVLVDGALAGYLARGGRHLHTWLPDEDPQRARVAAALARRVAGLVGTGAPGVAGRAPTVLIAEIDGQSALIHPLADALLAVGFLRTHAGLQRRGSFSPPAPDTATVTDTDAETGPEADTETDADADTDTAELA
jgi:hypothetical protein